MDRRPLFACVCVAAATTLCAQPTDLLPRFQASVKETLRRLPDYNCIETIARFRRSPPGPDFQPLDTLRLQVGLIDGRERYTWPDAARFDDRELRDLVGRGVIGTGNFAAHVQHVFLSPATRFNGPTAVGLHNRAAARFDYDVPVEYSRYKLRVAPEEAEVGVHGSFWIDLQTLDLLRLEVQADEIPPELGMSSVSEVMDYARLPIHDSNFLLPTSSQLTMVALDGEEHRNEITFTECHQFRADSNINFDAADAVPPSPVSRHPAAPVAFPSSVLVELTLDSDIDPEKATLGDPIRARVARPVRDGAEIIAPEGSMVRGRLIRLERAAQPFEHYVVGLEFHTLEAADNRFDFFATMQDAGPAPGLLRQAKGIDPVFTRRRTGRFDILVREKPRGEGILHWDAKHPQIRRGLKMRWLTVAPDKLDTRAP
jgi:hypothetical protein